MNKQYKSPNIYELGNIAHLTAGTISKGSETHTNTCGSCNYNVYWRNTSNAGRKP